MKHFINAAHSNLISLFSCAVSFIHTTSGVPDPYCLSPLNTEDCNGSPTPVFSYYKPGSRCEIETWRGCPTVNKFPDEYACSDLCIMKINPTQSEDEKKFAEANADPCEIPLNTSDCGKFPKVVFTYDKSAQKCVISIWRGCECPNQFTDRPSCENSCLKPQGTADSWSQQLSGMDTTQLDEVSQLLDSISSGNKKIASEDALAQVASGQSVDMTMLGDDDNAIEEDDMATPE